MGHFQAQRLRVEIPRFLGVPDVQHDVTEPLAWIIVALPGAPRRPPYFTALLPSERNRCVRILAHDAGPELGARSSHRRVIQQRPRRDGHRVQERLHDEAAALGIADNSAPRVSGGSGESISSVVSAPSMRPWDGVVQHRAEAAQVMVGSSRPRPRAVPRGSRPFEPAPTDACNRIGVDRTDDAAPRSITKRAGTGSRQVPSSLPARQV